VNFESIGGRKLALGAFVLLLGVLVDTFSKNGLSNNLLQLLMYVSIGFFGSNAAITAAHTIAAKKQDEAEAQAPAPEVDPEIKAKIEAVEQQLTGIKDGVEAVQMAVLTVIKKAGYDR